ncbi:hypothetical protein RF11_07831 [Thelohanellus kitauei]|uniref:Uncharacterized protein n=1 Tax=Thelohanellus kitauei TaxID=669202 RepID=A0A0C2MJS6_THEKT|nr:hypothetical protein RF11_07831 [Thelohanellus kitauei]
MDINQEVSNLKASLEALQDDVFLSIETKRKLNNMEKDGGDTKQQLNHFVDNVILFYTTCIDSEYVSKLSFALLKKTSTWSDVQATNDMVSIIPGRFRLSDDNRLFDQTISVARYATGDMIERWAQSENNAGQWWIEVFEHFKNEQLELDAILRLVQFALSLSRTKTAH